MTATGTGAIVLAAGSSSRMGQPKQFLRFQDESFVRLAASAALGAGCSPVVVVTGAQDRRITLELAGLAVEVRHHEHWNRGIGSSIRTGVEQALTLQDALAGLLVMVCDQPFVTAEVLSALIAAAAKTQKRAVASAYGDTIGVPALFARALFPELTSLPDEYGAKRVLLQFANEIVRIPFPAGSVDIDTPADFSAIASLSQAAGTTP